MLVKRIEFLERKDRFRNVIYRGVEDSAEANEDEKSNLMKIFERVGFKNIPDNFIVYAGRLRSKKQGSRPLKVEFNTLHDKMEAGKWREKLLGEGISFSNDYTREEREIYWKNKELQALFKKDLGITAGIAGRMIILFNVPYEYEAALKYYNDSKKGEQSDSPELNSNNKRQYKINSPRIGLTNSVKKKNKKGFSPTKINLSQYARGVDTSQHEKVN